MPAGREEMRNAVVLNSKGKIESWRDVRRRRTEGALLMRGRDTGFREVPMAIRI